MFRHFRYINDNMVCEVKINACNNKKKNSFSEWDSDRKYFFAIRAWIAWKWAMQTENRGEYIENSQSPHCIWFVTHFLVVDLVSFSLVTHNDQMRFCHQMNGIHNFYMQMPDEKTRENSIYKKRIFNESTVRLIKESFITTTTDGTPYFIHFHLNFYFRVLVN